MGATREQLMAVGSHCADYTTSMENFDQSETANISCENCLNWNGKECRIDVYDDVLSSLDQT
jgi:hypothetical protein